MGAFHQPDAADDEDHTDHHIRQAGHDEIEGAENGGGVAPAVDEVAESVHDEVLVGDERTEGDEQPAHQLVAVQQSPGQPPVAGVEVDEVVVLRRGVRDDLRPEVEGVKEAVHPQHHQQEQHRRQQDAHHPDAAGCKDEGEAPLHVALIHLACAGDEGAAEGQKSIFQHNGLLVL